MPPRFPLSRDLHVSPLVRVGRFDCGPEQVRWRVENQIGPLPLIAFPGTAVEIVQPHHAPIVATAGRAVLYNPHQEYRRKLLDGRGDHCVYITFEPALLHAALASAGIPAGDALERPFVFASAPLPARVVLAQLRLARALEHAGGPPEPLAADEQALAILAALLEQLPRRVAAPPTTTTARHAALADAIARHLALHFDDDDDLAALAARVGVSPFHAARIFRATTGSTIHAHRHHLRLHAALVRLSEGATDLARVAVDVGFASHSHLSEAFRRAYGAAPARLRAELASKILKAAPAAPR